MLEQIIDDGLQTLPSSRHADFLLAFHHSLTVDCKTYTPESFEPFGFDQRELYRLKVILLRPVAYTFLKMLDPALKDSRLDKLTSFEAYTQYFDRQPWLISIRPRILILTYTEWVALAFREMRPIPLPPRLNNP